MNEDITTKRADTQYKEVMSRTEVYRTILAALVLFAAAFAAGKFLG